MDDYLCITLLSRPGEAETAFKAQLSAFWTHLLRQHAADFEKVYAEKSAFEPKGDRLSRQYLVEAEAAPAIEQQLRKMGLDFEPIDQDELYSKFEATPPEWFWIEH